MLYVCMYVNERLPQFDPNNAIFTQDIHEGTGRVNSYIRLKSVQNWLKNQFFKRVQSFLNYKKACCS